MIKITLVNADCLDYMRSISNVFDMILVDPPYGCTGNRWDKIVPVNEMWELCRPLVRDDGATVVFGKEPFSSLVRVSNIDEFKYDWIWEKNRAVGFVNAKLRPMPKHEIISVFSRGTTANGCAGNMRYFPQGLRECSRIRKAHCGDDYWRPSHHDTLVTHTGYPVSVIRFACSNGSHHDTEKPVRLIEWLVRTYTLEGESVLDFCAGSGTTAVACMRSGRNCVCVEKDKDIFGVMRDRVIRERDEAFEKFGTEIELETM